VDPSPVEPREDDVVPLLRAMEVCDRDLLQRAVNEIEQLRVLADRAMQRTAYQRNLMRDRRRAKREAMGKD
jgi:hypothetical protein